ncbi:MAG: sigma-54 dependent transcriptional regulator [Planctomycetota bacterium]|nr:sigma-54 dependent transcriptional regulator [Planctomycetota bacterium]
MNILVIDDDARLRRTLRMSLEVLGHRAVEARDGVQAVELLGRQPFEMALLDLRLAREHGLELLPRLLSLAPGLCVVIVTAYATIETAVEAMRRGAFDYLPKPFTPDQLRAILDRIAQLRRLESQVADLEEQVRSSVPEVDLQTTEPKMRAVLDMAFKTAATEATILLRGESGTGKGVLARAIHARSQRAGHPFVTLHCPSLSAELLESELFGHAEGAFTGAVRDTVGKVAVAEGGTLFLDEIGDLPLALQPKLLRLLQERCYERVGETQTRAGNIRVLAATNRNLEAELATGHFREDLYYRLNVIEVTVPPLRDRPGDILPLAEHLLRFFAQQNAKPLSGFAEPVREALVRYAWPGNIRELRNTIERGVILAAVPIVQLADLPSQVGSPNQTRPGATSEPQTLDQMEAETIRRVLASAATLDEAAVRLGIDPSTLYRKRKKYGI